jgi:hypothetical protein
MLEATTRWSLTGIVTALIVGNFLGGLALALALPLLRNAVAIGPGHPVRARLEGVLLTVVGVAGWVVPWIVIVHWLRYR